MSLRLDHMSPADWLDVRSIYEEGLATGMGTFETEAPSWKEWDASRMPHSRLLARDGRTLGWAALSAVSKRACYAGVAEVGIYVARLHVDVGLVAYCQKRSSSPPRNTESGLYRVSL